MDLAKLWPWNWFRSGREEPPGLVVRRVDDGGGPAPGSLRMLHHELDRLFDHGFDGFGFTAPHLQRAMEEQSGAPRFLPRAVTTESADCLTIRVDLPGVLEADIVLELHGDTLVLLAPRRGVAAASAGAEASDPGRGAYRREFQLPKDIDAESLRTRFEDCALTLVLPRKTAAGSEE